MKAKDNKPSVPTNQGSARCGRAEDDLRQDETFLGRVISQNPFPIWIGDSEGTILKCNKALLDLLQLEEEQLVGKYNILQDPLIKHLHNDIRRIFDEGKNFEFEVQWEAQPSLGVDSPLLVIAGVVFPVFDQQGKITNTVATYHDITDLRKSEERFRALFEYAADAFFLSDTAGRFIDANQVACETLGYSREELLKLSIADVDSVHSADKVAALLDDLVVNESITIETIHQRKDGSRLPVEVRVRLFGPQKQRTILALARDITERKQAEQALREVSERMELALWGGDLGTWDWHVETGDYIVNELWAKLTGHALHEIEPVVESWEKLVHPDDMPGVREALTAHLEGNTDFYVAQYRFKHQSGEWLWGLENGRVIRRDEGGRPLRVCGTLSDITERRRAEEALVNMQKLESIGLLAGGIAHDFNNLLGGVFGCIEMASACPDGQGRSSYLRQAMGAIDRARGLTGQLLTFAKGGAPIREVQCLASLVEETAKFVLSGSSISCSFRASNDLWPCEVDRNQIGQAIDNIVINAEQAMPKGGTVEITAENTAFARGEHTTLPAGDYVEIAIKDHGVGLSQEILPKIFDPFFSTKAKGHGLGLSTSYSIVKRHGGCIQVQSRPGEGSTFVIYLPAATHTVSSDEGRRKQAHRGSGFFVVMDDDELFRDTVGKMLGTFGYTVVPKEDGRDAIDFLAKEKDAVAAMIFDLTIPGGMGGKEAIREVRRICPETPVFVASGYADDQVIADPVEYGFTASIAKPFTRAQMAQMLNRHM